jgi:hypothetical protein
MYRYVKFRVDGRAMTYDKQVFDSMTSHALCTKVPLLDWDKCTTVG